MTRRLAAGLLILLWIQGAVLAEERLAYVSDYFSFVGADRQGRTDECGRRSEQAMARVFEP